MNRFLLMAVLLVLMVLSTDALRGALFRSGRSVRNRETIIPPNYEIIDNTKRSGRAPLYNLLPVVEVDNGEPPVKYPSVYFRL